MTILSSPRVRYLAQGLKIVVFLSLFFIAFTAQAANPLGVIINEVAWIGTNISANDEWIELYNNTEGPINLDGWQLVSQDGTPKINLSGTIPANGFYLLERTDDTTVPNVPADQIYTGALGNSGETLELYDNFGNLIDRIDDSSGWSAGDNKTKQTMERKTDGNWQTSQNAGGTPMAKNSIVVQAEPQPKPESEKPAVEESTVEVRLQQTYPTGVVINEILPSPEGPDAEEEWIEIFNQNNFEVDLSNWEISDTAGKITTFTFSRGTKISPQGFLVLSRLETKITLNNDGDGLNLIQPDGKIIDTATYEKAPRGESYNRIDSKWSWSTTLTPGSANIVPAPQTFEEKTKEAKAEIKSPKVEEPETKRGLAAVGEQASKETPFLPLLIALSLAISSGAIILIFKKKLKKLQT